MKKLISILLIVLAVPAFCETVIQGKRLYSWKTDGSAGVVTDTLYRRCFWPPTEVPIAPFAAGSARIRVEGPPTPRNIIFPDDTQFINGTRGDCFFTSTTTIKSVTETQTFTTTATIGGKPQTVTYTKDVVVQKPVYERTEIPKPAVGK